jgi:integrative and conjugative element protein (TIGR02256 family)
MDVIERIVIPAEAVRRLHQESQRKSPKETGGILVGNVVGSVAFIGAVVGPGPRARHGRHSFTRDGDYAQYQLDILSTASNGRWDYLAEWHSHGALAGPSLTDCRSMERISVNPAYKAPQPLLLICCRSGTTDWRLDAYQWRVNRIEQLEVIIHSGASNDGAVSLPHPADST